MRRTVRAHTRVEQLSVTIPCPRRSLPPDADDSLRSSACRAQESETISRYGVVRTSDDRAMPMKTIATLLVSSLFLVNAAFADPPPGKGKGKSDNAEWRDGKGKGKERDRADAKRPDNGNGRDDRDSDRGQARSPVSVQRHFEDRHRTIVRDYYVTEYRSGHCPPGLAKKNNGCMPPGQAKKWRVGQPLPRDVVFYEVPSELVVRIGMPPPGYRYVRVAADILLIAVGTSMVMDAIADLGSL